MLVSAGISNHDLHFTFERKGGFPYWTFALFHKGEAFIKSGGQEKKSIPYDLKCIKPNTPYSTRIVPGYQSWHGDWIIATLTPEWEALINWEEELPGIYSLSVAGFTDQENIKKNFRKAVDLVLRPQPFSDLNGMHALEEVLLLSYQISQKKVGVRDKRIIKAIEILSNNLGKIIDIEFVSNQVGLSPSRFAHLFKEEVGETPMNYRESIRLNYAKQLIIGTNMSIKQIAEAVNYDCAFHFSKRFKAIIGVSPKEFRNQLGKPDFLKNTIAQNLINDEKSK